MSTVRATLDALEASLFVDRRLGASLYPRDMANEAKAQAGKKLTVAQANSVRATANRIRAVLACWLLTA